MGVSRIAAVSVTRRTGVPALAQQSDPVIVTDDTPLAAGNFSGNIARYGINASTSVATDWGTSSAAYKAFIKAAAQNRTCPYIYIAKRSTAVARAKTVTWSGDFASGDTITGTVNGDSISVAWNTDQATTMGDLNTAIAAAYGIDTSAGTTNVNTVTADVQYELDISLSAAGGNAPTATIAVSVAGQTISDDLATIFAENNVPYLVYLTTTNAGAIESASDYIQALNKLLFVQSDAAAIITAATTDVFSRIGDAANWRTAMFYTSDSTQHYPMALASLFLSYQPGQVAANNKRLTSITPDTLTDTEIGYAEGKYVNQYAETIGSIGQLLQGVTADGSQIHTVRDQDYFVTTLQTAWANWLSNTPKITFNNAGLKAGEGEAMAVVQDMEDQGVFDVEYDNNIVAPALSAVPTAKRTANIASEYTGQVKIGTAIVKLEASIDLIATS